MNAGASNVIVQGMLKGSFDVFDALLSLSFIYDTVEVTDLTDEALTDAMNRLTVGMRGRMLGGGAIAVLFSMENASTLVSLTNTGEAVAKDSLDDADLSTLQEIADSFLGGGVANLSEKFGEDVELEGVEVVVSGPDGLASLRDVLGDGVTIATFQYSAAPHFDSSAVLLFSQPLEGRVPKELVDAVFGSDEAPGLADDALVSDDEMKDILSGFSPEEESPAPRAAGAKVERPENLEVILDIELVATARLGRVDMPIGEVLTLGPGSIIEVGKLVDEPVELLVNDKLIARGDVVVVDEKFGLRITEIISRVERIESLR